VLAVVAGVLELAVLSTTEVVESRVLVLGFLAFFMASLIAGAGLLPESPSDDEPVTHLQSAYLAKAEGEKHDSNDTAFERDRSPQR